MPKYDHQDPTDLDIMKSEFDCYSEEDWQDYIELAESKGLGYKSINALSTAQKKARLSKFLSAKFINWVLNLVEELDAEDEKEASTEA